MNKFLVNHYWETVDFIDKNQKVIDNVFSYVNDILDHEYDISLGSYEDIRRDLLVKALKKDFKSEELVNKIISVKDSTVNRGSLWKLSFKDSPNTVERSRINRILSDMLGSYVDYTQYDEEYESDRHITLKYYTSKRYAPISEIRRDLGYDESVPDSIVERSLKHLYTSTNVPEYIRDKYIREWPLPERDKKVIGKKFIDNLNKESSKETEYSSSSTAQSFVDSFSTYGSNEGSSSNYGGIL